MNLREIFANATLISGSNIGTSIVNFFTFIVTIKILGTYGFGLYSLALSVLAVATLFLDLGLGKLVVADVAKDFNEGKKDSARSLLGGYIMLQATITLVGALVLILMAGQMSDYFAKDVDSIIRLVAILIFFGAAKNVFTTTFQVVSNFRRYSEFLFVESFSKLAAVIGIAYVLATVEGMLLATLISEIVTVAMFWRFLPFELIPKFNIKDMKVNFTRILSRHGKWTVLFSQARNIESNVSLWIVGFFLGVNAVGIYSALLRGQTIVIRVFEPLETIFFPAVSKIGGIEDSRKVIFRATKYILYLSIPSTLALLVFAEPVIWLILGQEFVHYADVLRILLFTVFIFILNIPMKPFFYNPKAQRELTFISIIILASTLAIGSALTFYLGLTGIALNHILSSLIDLHLKRRAMVRITGVNYSLLELVLPDSKDFDLMKRFLADPMLVLGVKK